MTKRFMECEFIYFSISDTQQNVIDLKLKLKKGSCFILYPF